MSKAAPTLADLVSPLTDGEFLALLRRREFAYRPASDDSRYAPLLSWRTLRDMLESGNHPNGPDDIRVSKESVMAPRERWTTNGKVDARKLDEFLANGFSVVVIHIDPYVPALAAICDEIRSRTLERSYVGIVVTSGAANGAFRVHFDPEDLLILQVEGTKRWQVFGPAVSNPLRAMPNQKPPEPEPIFDEVLEPGDMLFVPAGNWHHCESGLSTSVHLGIFFLPPTGWHAVNALVRPLISEEMFRMPLTRLDDPSALEAMEAEVKGRLIEKIGALKLAEYVSGWNKPAG
ncbi:MAG: cupin domain-containing protein [Acetobacteraceae bacterium]